MERFEESAFCREIEAFRLPRYADLPDFRLYIDQLIALVEKTLAPLMGADGEKWITATMIGNYARNGVSVAGSKPGQNIQNQRSGHKYMAFCEETHRFFLPYPLMPPAVRPSTNWF